MCTAGTVWTAAWIDYDLEVDLGIGFGGIVEWLPGGRGIATSWPRIDVERDENRDGGCGGGRRGESKSDKCLNDFHNCSDTTVIRRMDGRVANKRVI